MVWPMVAAGTSNDDIKVARDTGRCSTTTSRRGRDDEVAPAGETEEESGQ